MPSYQSLDELRGLASWRVSACGVALTLAMVLCSHVHADTDSTRPNILWITCEDTGPELGCYGDTYANTPTIDALAQRGQRYLNCWSNAPVCAPARTTIITGIYPTSYGAQHMRCSVPLPNGTKTLPELLQAQGYYCSNNSKEDYNFPKPDGMWSDSSKTAHWRNRSPGQPFFSVFNILTTHESQIRKRPYTPVHDPAQAKIPPYHPDTPEVRLDLAQYYDRISEMDRAVAEILKELEQDGLMDSTIVFFFGDHGSGLPRSKRWLYQSGLRVGMIVCLPESMRAQVEDSYAEGRASDRLIAFVDLVPTVLDLANIPAPDDLHGRSFFGPEEQANDYLIGFRDRMDERIDSSRAIRDKQYLYIRNFMPFRPQGAYLDYMFQTPTTQEWYQHFQSGRLTEVQSQFWRPKPMEELYDLEQDPHQVTNLTGQPALAVKQAELATALKSWMSRTQDTGPIPEGSWLWNREIPHAEALDAAWDSGDAITNIDACKEMLTAASPIRRYWGAIAARSAMERNPDFYQADSNRYLPNLLTTALHDESDLVRIMAAECMLQDEIHGYPPYQLALARTLLVQRSMEKDIDWGVRLAALNALCDVPLLKEDISRIATAFARSGDEWLHSLPNRFEGYHQRLVLRLQELAGLPPGTPKK